MQERHAIKNAPLRQIKSSKALITGVKPKKESKRSTSKNSKHFKSPQIQKANPPEESNSKHTALHQKRITSGDVSNDYGVGSFYAKYKVKTIQGKRKQGQSLVSEEAAFPQFDSKQIQQMGEKIQEGLEEGFSTVKIQKVKLPKNRGIINADGKFVVLSKQKKLKNYSIQNSNSKQSHSLTNIISLEQKKKKKLTKQGSKLTKMVKSTQKGVKCKSADRIQPLRNEVKSNEKIKQALKKKILKKKSPLGRTLEGSGIKSTQHQTQTQIQIFQTSFDQSIIFNDETPILIEVKSQIQLEMLASAQLEKRYKFADNFLKDRAKCIMLLTKICHGLRLQRETFSLSIIYMDRYLLHNQYQNIKIVALAALSIALKVDDAEMSSVFCCQMMGKLMMNQNCKKSNSSQQLKAKKNSIPQQTTKSKLALIINSRIFDDKRKEEFKLEQILQFQIQMLKKLEYKLTQKSIAYWTDTMTTLWDSFVKQFYISKENKKQYELLLFRTGKDYENFSFLVQCIEMLVYHPISNNYSRLVLVLACLYLLIRIRLQQLKEPSSPFEQICKSYRLSLAKNSNLIFCDQLGVNQLFGDFLQNLELNMASIIECTQMAGKSLQPQILRIWDYRKIEGKNFHERLGTYLGNHEICKNFLSTL